MIYFASDAGHPSLETPPGRGIHTGVVLDVLSDQMGRLPTLSSPEESRIATNSLATVIESSSSVTKIITWICRDLCRELEVGNSDP